MNRDWARLGQQLATGRERIGLTQEQAAARLEIAKSTLGFIETGKPRKKVTPTIRAYSRLVGWTDDSVTDVLDGGDPTMREASEEPSGPGPAPETRPTPEPSVKDLSLHARQALREGPLLYERVITMETAGGAVRTTIVVRGEQDATEEEMLAALEEWRERERSRGGLDDN
jgi:DNA-binding XRE family transcriptional regulator